MHAATHPWPVRADAKAIVESQALSIRLRARQLVEGNLQPRRIYLVGGAANNTAIARVLADVLGATEGAWNLTIGGSACALGAAYKACWAVERTAGQSVMEMLIQKNWKESGAIRRVNDSYQPGVFAQYGAILGAFEIAENTILSLASNN